MQEQDNEQCFAHCHMRASEFGFYELCRALAHKSGTVYFDGRAIAARFGKMSKTTAYELAATLTAKGFFKIAKQPGYRKNGTFSPYYFKVLSHDEWAIEHPGQCSPVLPAGLVVSPVRKEDQPVRIQDQPVRNLAQPVRPAGHNPIKSNPLNSNPISESDTAAPVQPTGQVDSFIHRFIPNSRTGPKRDHALADSAPVLPAGQGVYDSASEAELEHRAEHVIQPFIGALGIELGGKRAPWLIQVQNLLFRGHAREAIHDVLGYYVRRHSATHARTTEANDFARSFDQLQREMQAADVTREAA